MDQSEQNEATLEKIIQKLREEIEQRTNSFTAKDIAVFSGTIPYITTMLEYREKREQFLNRLEQMKHTLKPHFFTDELIEKCHKFPNVSKESSQSMLKFFQNEVEKVKSIHIYVLSNFNNDKYLQNNESTFEQYMTEISTVLKQYQLTIARLQSQTAMSYTIEDLLTMIRIDCFNYRRRSLLKAFKIEFKRFPLTYRREIVERCLSLVESDLSESGKRPTPDLPYYLTKVEELDCSLVKLASRFGVNANIQDEDGQLFLYHCDKTTTSCWNSLLEMNPAVVSYQDKGPKVTKSQYMLADEQLYKATIIDEKLKKLLSVYFNDNDRDVLFFIKTQAGGYNQMVGNRIQHQFSSGILKRKTLLQNDRLMCWFKLRIVYAKYLFASILSYYNYFESMKQNLYQKQFHWTCSQKLSNLFEIKDIEKDEIVLIENAKKRFEEFKSTMISIISYYTVLEEVGNEEDNFRNTKIIDYYSMIEQFLEYELQYCNSKQRLLQYLYECNLHQNSDKIIQQIYEMVEEKPKFHVTTFSSFKYPYELAIKIMEKRSNLVSTLYYLQIMHERQIAVRLPSTIPLFYRPILLACDFKTQVFHESFPLSPFEIYQTLPYICSVIKYSEEIALDISQGMDFRDLQFIDYMNLAVLEKMRDIVINYTSKGIFPFEMKDFPFACELSDSVFSLMTSPYVNDLNSIEDLINSISESKRLRFCLSYLRFLHISWKIQKSIIDSDLLHKNYLVQATLNNIPETRLFLQSFSYIATEELIDVHEQYTNEKLLEFAIVDFAAPDFHFNDKKFLSNYILENQFTKLQRIYQFQNFHCFILEIAERYNNLYLDSDYLVNHFGLESNQIEMNDDDDSTLFLTQADGVPNTTTEALLNVANGEDLSFIRSFHATKLLFDSQYIVENLKKANSKKEYCFLNVKQQKTHTRSLISAQAKINPMNDEQLYQLYFTEMIDAFSAFAYRLEIANVCRLEKQTILMNSFSDTFIVEPTTFVLVNEAGRAQNHFVVPSWADTLFLVRTAPLPRQTAIFKIVLEHVANLYQILHLVRFEVSLSQKVGKAYQTLYDNDFHLETATLQRLCNELSRLPGGNEFDVSAKYLESKLFYFMQRLELALFQAYETSHVSVSNGDVSLGSATLELHKQMTSPLPYVKGLFTSHRFIPEWTNQFMGDISEINRNEVVRQLTIIDQRVDDILASHKLHSVLESSQALSVSLDFIAIALLHKRLKYSMFLLLSGVDEKQISDPFVCISQKDFLTGLTDWNEKIIPDAYLSMVPKDDSVSTIQEKNIPEDKLLQAQIEVARNFCDTIILGSQIDEMKKISEIAFEHFSKPIIKIHSRPPEFSPEDRPLLENPENIDKIFHDHLNTSRYLILKLLMSELNQITIGSSIQTDQLEKILLELSDVLIAFTDESIHRIPQVWHYILKPFSDLSRQSEETEILLDIFNKLMQERFDHSLRFEIATKLADSLFCINKLEARIHDRKHEICKEDIEQDEFITTEYDRLLFDLNKHKSYMKLQFKKKREKIYSIVLKRIEKAKDVKFDRSAIQFSSINSDQIDNPEEIFEPTKQNINKMKTEIRKLRIIRCLSCIAVKRYYAKRIQSYESDRIQERAKLWETKREFETLQTRMLEELKKAYRTLASDEIEIERLKQQIDNEKQTTIQLVHYKALNAKKEDELTNELKKYAEVEKVDVGSLLTKLKAAREQLEVLTEETEYLETETERTIRTPMRQAEKVRKKILTAKISRCDAIKSRSMPRPQTSLTAANDSLLTSYRNENVQLISKNEQLKQKIQLLQNTKDQMSTQTLSYISDVVPAERTFLLSKDIGRPQRQNKKTITRPKTTFAPRKSAALDQLLKRSDT